MKKALLLFYITLLLFWSSTGYLRSDAMFLAGLGVMGLSLVVREPGRGSWRFGLLALLCVGLAFAVPARTFHYLALVFSAFFVVENYWGKINEAPVFTALLLTAVAKTMGIVLGFPMRLQLSENAAAALRAFGSKAEAVGNLIHFEGKEFLVDAACAGLQMVEVSFLFCFFLLGLFERRTGRFLRLPGLLATVLATGVLILVFNQLRIIFLVVFNIPPQNPMHDVVGLLGLGLYVFAPLWWGLKWAFGRISHKDDGMRIERFFSGFHRFILENLFNPFNPRSILLAKAGLHIILIGFLLYFAVAEHRGELQHATSEQALIPAGLPADCRREPLKGGIVKYTNDSLLIYVKPLRGWFDTEHTPLICWQGSGYEFGQMEERIIGSTTIYTGILEKKGASKYYTAWWFDNGKERTVSQARWRWLDARGAPGFSLVNITASERELLEIHIKKMTQ
ncbi:MAG: exosortase N [Saprospiraceae bacterium]